MIKVGTDFSGIGSPEAALRRLRIPHDLIFGCEIDKYARKSYSELNFPDILYDDITTRDYEEVPQLDLYCAGFPCQSFSVAGKRAGFDDTRGTLFFNVAEFIKINQPECFILENVKGLLSHDNGRTYQTITDVLTNGGGTLNGQMGMDTIDDGLGYHVYTQVLNTKDYGIPQNRERIFIVGFKYYRDFRFPKKIDLELKLKDILQDNPNSKYYLSDKMKSHILTPSKGDWKTSNLEIDRDVAQCINARVFKMAKADTDNYISVDKSTTRIRRLTPLECWRLQGFTDDEFNRAAAVNSDTQLYKQAGNSITVNVMAEILKKIYLK
jgi:DNA (cytosine-5)-methyltransferase 1